MWWRDLIGRYEVSSRLGTFSRKDRDIVLVLFFSCITEKGKVGCVAKVR